MDNTTGKSNNSSPTSNAGVELAVAASNGNLGKANSGGSGGNIISSSNNSTLIKSNAAVAAALQINGSSSPLISLKVRLVDANIAKTLQFSPSTLVYDALRIIREKLAETNSMPNCK
jgi:hypothetical protein